jgi:chemotaxis response regulator CheB
MNEGKIQVMIVDDSALVRQVVAQALAREPGIEVMSTAADPLFAMDKMRRNWPDVIILDIEMTRMHGLSFLRKLMAVAIGTSTGGTQALEAVLTGCPTSAAASSSSSTCPRNSPPCSPSASTAVQARSARGPERRPRHARPRPDRPRRRHMMLRRSGAQYYVEVADGPLVNRHKPSVDVLFRSVAQIAGATRWA